MGIGQVLPQCGKPRMMTIHRRRRIHGSGAERTAHCYELGEHLHVCRRCYPINVERFNFYDMLSCWSGVCNRGLGQLRFHSLTRHQSGQTATPLRMVLSGLLYFHFLVRLGLRCMSCLPSLARNVMLVSVSSIGMSLLSLRLTLSVSPCVLCLCVTLPSWDVFIVRQVCRRLSLPFQPVFEVCAVYTVDGPVLKDRCTTYARHGGFQFRHASVGLPIRCDGDRCVNSVSVGVVLSHSRDRVYYCPAGGCGFLTTDAYVILGGTCLSVPVA